MGQECICKVCDCGRHHCPPKSHAAEGPFQGVSEYNKNYLNKPIEKVQNFKPPYIPLETGAFSANTENREQYVPRLAERQVVHNPQVPTKVYVPSSVKFEGESTTNRDYKPHEIEQRHAKAKAQWQPTEGTVSSVTTNRNDYKAWEPQPRYQHQKAQYKPSEAKLEGQSIQKTDFQAWPVQRHKAHEQEKYIATQDARTFDTTSTSAYQPFGAVGRTGSFKPAQVPPPKTKFEGKTTNEDDFKQWPTQRVQHHEREKYVPNPAHFEGHSEYVTSYIPKAVEPHKAAPGSKQQYVPSSAKFDGEPLYKSDFSPKVIPPRFERVKEAFVSAPEERNFATEAQSSYIPQHCEPCPVIKRHNEPTEKHSDGHVYFVHA